jgi:hypothetical protein
LSGPFAAKPQHEFDIWHVPDRSPVVVYSVAVIRHLASLAERAAAAAGGEIRGVLYGTSDGGEIRITAHRPLVCEHPGMVDEEAWRRSIQEYSSEPHLSNLNPVGWYLSHAASGIALSPDEVSVWNSIFPGPFHLALVLHPVRGQSTRAGFFFRAANGSAQTASSLREFEAAPPPSRRIFGMLNHSVEDSHHDHEEIVPQPPPRELFDAPAPIRRSPSRPLWYIAACLTILVVATSAFFWMDAIGQSSLTAPSIQIARRHGQLRAFWDGSAPAVLAATSGSIEFQDGDARVSLPLSQTLLRNGSWPIVAATGDVRVRLRLNLTDPNAAPLESAARFLNYSAPAESPEPAADSSDESRAELARLQSQLAALTASNSQLERNAVNLQIRWNARQAEAKPAPPQPVAVAAPPEAGQRPAPSAPPPAPGLFTERPQPRIPVTLPPPEPPKPAPYTGPSTGKLIWTGLLPAGGTITIDNRRPSTGSLNGALPGVPVRVNLYPAEFSAGGLSVYSGNARHSRGNLVEPRSAQNGWLETRYIYDPARAGSVSLIDAPSEANNYQRVNIRADRPQSVIIVEWEVIR